MELTIGTRIYNHGDRANPSHFGTITKIHKHDLFVDQYEITPDTERKPYSVPLCGFSAEFKGHSGTRIVTETEYYRWRESLSLTSAPAGK